MVSLLSLPEHVKKNGPWSISKLGTIEQCSLKFHYKYGPPKFKEPETATEESQIGVLVHRALELALGGMKPARAVQQALDERDVLSDQRDTVMGFFEQICSGVNRFEKLKAVWGVKNTPNHVMIERKWGLRADFSACQFFDNENVVFRGVVDYALLTAKNNLVIVDHKTGKERALDYYDAQFKSYCLLAVAKFPEVKNIQTGINFVLADKPLWSPKTVSAEQVREEYRPWLISYMTKACEGLTEPPTPTKQKLCDWCGYKSICPAHGGDGRGESKDS